MKNNQNKSFLYIFAVALVTIFSTGNFAQSRDIDKPTPLKSRILTGELKAHSNDEFFYSFVAEPGTFTVVLDVKTTGPNSTLDITFISNSNSGSGVSASAIHKGSERRTKTFNVAKKKRIIMKLKDFSAADGTFKITLSGALALPK